MIDYIYIIHFWLHKIDKLCLEPFIIMGFNYECGRIQLDLTGLISGRYMSGHEIHQTLRKRNTLFAQISIAILHEPISNFSHQISLFPFGHFSLCSHFFRFQIFAIHLYQFDACLYFSPIFDFFNCSQLAAGDIIGYLVNIH